MTFSNEIVIARPADIVFAYLARLENIPRWNYAIRETSQHSPGQVGVGTIYRQTRTLPRPMWEELEITAFEPPRLLSVRGGFGPFQGSSTYVLAADGAQTLLKNEITLSATGAQRLLGGLAGQQIKRAVARNLDVLRRLLEGTSIGDSERV
jgi:uncharacterized protein YndB with AHSA1/START domain